MYIEYTYRAQLIRFVSQFVRFYCIEESKYKVYDLKVERWAWKCDGMH